MLIVPESKSSIIMKFPWIYLINYRNNDHDQSVERNQYHLLCFPWTFLCKQLHHSIFGFRTHLSYYLRMILYNRILSLKKQIFVFLLIYSHLYLLLFDLKHHFHHHFPSSYSWVVSFFFYNHHPIIFNDNVTIRSCLFNFLRYLWSLIINIKW